MNGKTMDKHRRKPSISAVQRTVSLNAMTRESAIFSALQPQTVVNWLNGLGYSMKTSMRLGEVG